MLSWTNQFCQFSHYDPVLVPEYKQHARSLAVVFLPCSIQLMHPTHPNPACVDEHRGRAPGTRGKSQERCLLLVIDHTSVANLR